VIPKLDANTDEALEKTDKSKRDGQDQGNESDDGIQNEESTPIKEVLMFAVYHCFLFHMLLVVVCTVCLYM
jgi:hypothetical protein